MDHYAKAVELLDRVEADPTGDATATFAFAALAHATLAAAPRTTAMRAARQAAAPAGRKRAGK